MAVKAPLNYIGNKYRMIEPLEALFPRDIDTFVDLFCGGCDVSINTPARRIFANDINRYVVEIYRTFQSMTLEEVLTRIDETIARWGLTKSDAAAYNAFRAHYNATRDPLDLYVLMCYSFNYQFRFNSEHEFNNPFGRERSSFNPRMRENLKKFHGRLAPIQFSSVDFTDFDYTVLREGDLLYADPPYLLSCGSYNDGKRGFKGWTRADDEALFAVLDSLHARGVRFALSNVREHKGQVNELLLDWARRGGYRLHEIAMSYGNCSYHAKMRGNTTREILVTNYDL